MSIWWFLWFILSSILLGTTIWSFTILFKQKRAWAAYAKSKGLVFTKGTLSGPCAMEGSIDGFNVSFFTAIQEQEDSRKNRQLTVIQLVLGKPFIDFLAAGTSEMLPFLNSMEIVSPHSLENDKWNSKANHIYSRNKEAVNLYLTDNRIAILNNILKLSNSDNLILLDDEKGVFRFETSNPLTDDVKIDKLVTKLMVSINKLLPDTKEIAKFKKKYTAKENS